MPRSPDARGTRRFIRRSPKALLEQIGRARFRHGLLAGGRPWAFLRRDFRMGAGGPVDSRRPDLHQHLFAPAAQRPALRRARQSHRRKSWPRVPEDVAVLASGGMSHYPGTWKYYTPAFDFDRWCIHELENSHSDSFINLSAEQLDEVGNTEMLPWAAVLGAVGPQHMELLSYQPTTHHGHAVGDFPSRRRSPTPILRGPTRSTIIRIISTITRRLLPTSSTSCSTICASNPACGCGPSRMSRPSLPNTG